MICGSVAERQSASALRRAAGRRDLRFRPARRLAPQARHHAAPRISAASCSAKRPPAWTSATAWRSICIVCAWRPVSRRELDAVPLLQGATLEQALHDGEDYELLYTAPPRRQVPGIRIGTIDRRQNPAASHIKANQLHQSAMTTSNNVVLDLIDAFRRSKTMFAAVELGIFDGQRPADCKELSRLLDACVALGLLEKQGDRLRQQRGRRKIPALGQPRHADRLHPLFQQRALSDVGPSGRRRTRRNASLEADVRPGWPHLFAFLPHRQKPCATSSAACTASDKSASPAVVAAFDLSRFRRLVDLGGAQRPSGRSRARALSASSNRRSSICPPSRRLYPGTIAGDFFTDPLPEADLYSLGRILHDWSEEKIRTLLAKIYAALPEGGGLLVAEQAARRTQRSRAHAVAEHAGRNGRPRALGRRDTSCCCRSAGFSKIESRRTGSPLDATLAIK